MGTILLLAAAEIKASAGGVEPVAELLDIKLRLDPFSASSLDSIDTARLKSGQYLVSNLQDGGLQAQARIRLQDRWYLLTGVFDGFQTAHIRGAAKMMQRLITREPRSFYKFIDEYSTNYDLPIRVLSSIEAGHFADKLSTMHAPNYHASYDIKGSSGRFYTYFSDIDQVVELGPVMFRQGLKLQSVMVIVVFAILLTGLAVYWLMYRFEVNLQRLERATTRIASGHLSSRVNVDSQDAFGRLGEAFNRMANQIQRLMGVQKEMIRAVSHELRTPVARMRFGVQMLEDTAEDAYTQKQLHEMDQDLQELDELVDEILTYARLEEGGPILEFKSANMLDLVDQVVEETRRRTDKVQVNWHSETVAEDEIFSDVEYRYLHRALQNLVGNACRYAQSQVHIEYSFENGLCRIDVEDDGSGIPEKDWTRVFSPFTRLDDSRTRASGGYGLGLSIVRRIIFWHGGEASVGESRWQGAKMTLAWPQTHQSQ
ncbi:ATP-binding protein [Oceaniserpentilla sp. 4NH20-0058]|uniref:ATP-binding protein n=1 Tax=Oceaniserpentilla sp. 4NH20-0058 TaxID=3127660 RepID=UPI00333E518C